MKTIKYYITATVQFYKSLNVTAKEKSGVSRNLEFTPTRVGINFKQDSISKKTPKSLFHQMYAEENQTLFI